MVASLAPAVPKSWKTTLFRKSHSQKKSWSGPVSNARTLVKEGTPVSPRTRTLVAYMAGALRRKLPAPVAERAKLHLVDTFAAIVSGTKLLPGQRVIGYIKPFGGKPE